jgi:hypothetical protein
LSAAIPAVGEQMMMRPEEIFRLKASGLMKRLEEAREEANSLGLPEKEGHCWRFSSRRRN